MKIKQVAIFERGILQGLEEVANEFLMTIPSEQVLSIQYFVSPNKLHQIMITYECEDK